MPASHLTTHLIPRVKAGLAMSDLSADTVPNKAQVIAWLNQGVNDLLRESLPIMAADNTFLPRRVDKLWKITTYVTKGPTGYAAVNGIGTLPLPTASLAAEFYSVIKIGVTTAYVASKRPLRELYNRIGAVDTTKPIYAFSNGILYFLPAAASSIAYYWYIKIPAPMVETTNEDFPLDLDLMPWVTTYALKKAWSQGQRNLELAKGLGAFYQGLIDRLVGQQKLVETT